MLDVFVERRRPRGLLWRRVDLDRSGNVGHGGKRVAHDVTHRPVRRQRDEADTTVDMFDDDFVPMQVERDAERTGTVGSRERRGLPSARGQAQGAVLQLRLRWCQLRSQLAEHLRVRVQRVARRRPIVVSKRGPDRHTLLPPLRCFSE